MTTGGSGRSGRRLFGEVLDAKFVMEHYHINIFWSDQDGSWIADVPDLRYCSAHGPTPEQALHGVQTAMAAWLESARAHGDPIPKPRYRPAIYAAGRPAA